MKKVDCFDTYSEFAMLGESYKLRDKRGKSLYLHQEDHRCNGSKYASMKRFQSSDEVDPGENRGGKNFLSIVRRESNFPKAFGELGDSKMGRWPYEPK